MASARTAAAHVGKLLDSLADPVCLIDEDRKVVFCNAACARWLGVSAESLVGKQCNFHSRPDSDATERAAAMLCPSPEVFEGKQSRGPVTRLLGDRQALVFIPLTRESGEVGLVIATATEEPVAGPEVSESDTALHDALFQFRARQMRKLSLDRLIGISPQMALARERVRLALDTAASVLIEGPAGSGRDRVARTIHQRGGKPQGPLVALACAELPAEVLVSMLENAVQEHPARAPVANSTGTLLLTDIDLLPREAILSFTKLLVPSRTSLRLIATCTHSLTELARDRVFPRALICGLSEIEIHLPPLDERREDIALLAQAFLEDVNAAGGKQVSGFLPETLDLLVAHRWNGNLDELAQVVTESHERASSTRIAPRDLPKAVVLAAEASARPKKSEEAIDLVAFLERVERELIERALARAKGNKSRAARMLGMTRPRFYRRLEQLKLVDP